jgi:RimJ/RimL family protein N-acetyltransferase
MAPLTAEIERVDVLTPALAEQITGIFPEDNLKQRRSSNLKRAKYVLVARVNNDVTGVLFVRNIFLIPNATWVVRKEYQRQGLALRLLRRAQEDLRYITAISRNLASANLARKANFVVFPLGVCIWIRFGAR